MQEAYIIDAIRIPRARSGAKSLYGEIKAVDLLKPLFQTLAKRYPKAPSLVEEVVLGCNTQLGDQGANTARIAPLYAGWQGVMGTTLNSFCCSSLDAINRAAAQLKAGGARVVVAGGVEHLSRVPMFSDKGAWFADQTIAAQTRFVHMGLAADLLANLAGYSKTRLDEVGVASHQRASLAWEQDRFPSVIPIKDKAGKTLLEQDNGIRPNADITGYAALEPAFAEVGAAGGTAVALRENPQLQQLDYRHSVGTSPALVDGASLVLLADEEGVRRLGAKPRARIRAWASAAGDPLSLTAHIHATEKAFTRSGLTANQIDLFEINESFAATVLAYRDAFSIPTERCNINGGAIAMGHPLGATGAILLGTLLDNLEQRDLQRGVVAIPGGAGIGVATLIERVV